MAIRFSAFLAALLATAVVASGQTSLGIAYKYNRLYNPGWFINPRGINNNNVIVGSYVDFGSGDPATHGFIYEKGNFTVVDFPGTNYSSATGINDDGDVVGYYALPNNPQTHGYLLHQGVFTTINGPGSSNTYPSAINNLGTIVGTCTDENGVNHGFVYHHGVFQKVDAPLVDSNGRVDTLLFGVNNAGMIVGSVSDRSGGRGFWLYQNVFHFLNARDTIGKFPLGINDRGDIVGSSQTRFLAFGVPAQGVSNVEYIRGWTYVQGLNDARILIGVDGEFLDAAFVATPILTIQVSSPANRSNVTNPVHVAATAVGQNPGTLFEVWVNYQKVYSVEGTSLDADMNVPVGMNERFVIKAVDSSGEIAKVVDQINVN
ncbi:MAG TPA: hypothetical protein VH437_18255 [Terriglobales bacterium]|jgi:probable HAF family extracellular repeat protein